MKSQALLLFHCIVFGCFNSCSTSENEIPVVKKWDTLTLDFTGPELSEMDADNPFLDYRLDVIFTHEKGELKVPGYFAADGNAAETSAEKGNVWRVKFTPPNEGLWHYQVSFKKGKNIAISDEKENCQPVGEDGKEGEFKVVEGDFAENDFRSQGRLQVVSGMAYQQFAESKKYYLKGGADSPENLLAYMDFDGTYDIDTANQFLHKYEPHEKDWQPGDTTWQGGKGKGIIGALNYLAGKGMNAVYFLTMNIEGDGKDVWPYRSPDDFTRFDCSKLDQWDIVFSHAQSKGILLHFVTQETENELLLDNGDTGPNRRLYYRELIARYGHHLAVIWNMGEENGPVHFSPNGQSDEQRRDMFTYFKNYDPFQNLVTLHTMGSGHYKDSILMPLLGEKNLDALSLQIGDPFEISKEIKKWRELPQSAGRPWVLYLDEIGPYWQGVLPDAVDMAHDTTRREALWGSLMAGGAGVEWYFGYKHPHSDLSCEDWRSRDKMWEQTHNAIDFFQKHLPFWDMENRDDLLKNADGQCLAKPSEVYAVYLPLGTTDAVLEDETLDGKKVTISWYNPRRGGDLIGEKKVVVNRTLQLGAPPGDEEMDWVVLVNGEDVD